MKLFHFAANCYNIWVAQYRRTFFGQVWNCKWLKTRIWHHRTNVRTAPPRQASWVSVNISLVTQIIDTYMTPERQRKELGSFYDSSAKKNEDKIWTHPLHEVNNLNTTKLIRRGANQRTGITSQRQASPNSQRNPQASGGQRGRMMWAPIIQRLRFYTESGAAEIAL